MASKFEQAGGEIIGRHDPVIASIVIALPAARRAVCFKRIFKTLQADQSIPFEPVHPGFLGWHIGRCVTPNRAVAIRNSGLELI